MKGLKIYRLPVLALCSQESVRPPADKIREVLNIKGPYDIPNEVWAPVGGRFVVYYERRNELCHRNRFENYFRLIEVQDVNEEVVLAEGAAGGLETNISRRESAHECFKADIEGLGRCKVYMPLHITHWKDWPEKPA